MSSLRLVPIHKSKSKCMAISRHLCKYFVFLKYNQSYFIAGWSCLQEWSKQFYRQLYYWLLFVKWGCCKASLTRPVTRISQWQWALNFRDNTFLIPIQMRMCTPITGSRILAHHNQGAATTAVRVKKRTQHRHSGKVHCVKEIREESLVDWVCQHKPLNDKWCSTAPMDT